MYDNNVFDIIRKMDFSPRGELEITSVNNEYIQKNQLTYDILRGYWTDAGTFETFRLANEILFNIDNKIISGDE